MGDYPSMQTRTGHNYLESSEGQRRTRMNKAKASSTNLAMHAVPVGNDNVMQAGYVSSSPRMLDSRKILYPHCEMGAKAEK